MALNPLTSMALNVKRVVRQVLFICYVKICGLHENFKTLLKLECFPYFHERVVETHCSFMLVKRHLLQAKITFSYIQKYVLLLFLPIITELERYIRLHRTTVTLSNLYIKKLSKDFYLFCLQYSNIL